jgi:hypothetical protein
VLGDLLLWIAEREASVFTLASTNAVYGDAGNVADYPSCSTPGNQSTIGADARPGSGVAGVGAGPVRRIERLRRILERRPQNDKAWIKVFIGINIRTPPVCKR